MKMFLFSCIAALMSIFSNAQSFGVHAGGNLGSAAIKDKSAIIPIAPASKLGLMVGVVADFPISSEIHFRPEINFLQKGYSFEQDFAGVYTIKRKETLNYIELPLNVNYLLVAGAHRVFLGAGPSIGLGLSGKREETIQQVTENADVNFGGDEVNDDYKPLDFGLNIHGGFQMQSGLFFKLAYTFGMTDLSHDSEISYKNKGFSFSVGYLFSHSAKKTSK